MLSEKQILEIREHLERAQNPLFYYDNDADGLCSFIILRKFLDRGKGVAVRSFPDLNASYARKAQELNADYIFVLDKPVIAEEFIEEVDKLGLPLVWIDHHDLPLPELKREFNNFYVYNPTRNTGKDKSEEPVTYLSYKIANRKEDVWLAVVGCIADHYLPDFAPDFEKVYEDFWGNVKKPFDAYYRTEIGKVAQAFNFGLKDSITNVVRLQNFLLSCNSPREVLEESVGNYYFRKKYTEIRKKYDSLVLRAGECVDGNIIFFDYSGELSISSDISNELSYKFPGKYVAVAYKNGAITNLSLRGKNVKKILANVLKEVEGRGGGHEDAVGARINTGDLEKFRELLKKEIGK